MARFLSFGVLILCSSNTAAFSLSMGSDSKATQFGHVGSRRSFVSTACATVVGGTSILSRPQPTHAATAKEIITTPTGIKYAVTKEPSDKKPVAPYKGEDSLGVHRTPLSLSIFHRHYPFLPHRRLRCNRLHRISRQRPSEYIRLG
jgi:hypothetical protein